MSILSTGSLVTIRGSNNFQISPRYFDVVQTNWWDVMTHFSQVLSFEPGSLNFVECWNANSSCRYKEMNIAGSLY